MHIHTSLVKYTTIIVVNSGINRLEVKMFSVSAGLVTVENPKPRHFNKTKKKQMLRYFRCHSQF